MNWTCPVCVRPHRPAGSGGTSLRTVSSCGDNSVCWSELSVKEKWTKTEGMACPGRYFLSRELFLVFFIFSFSTCSNWSLQVTLVRNYTRSCVKNDWLRGRYSHVRSADELRDRIMVPLDVESWGEILQAELDRWDRNDHYMFLSALSHCAFANSYF